MVSVQQERGELSTAVMPVGSLSEAAAAVAVIVLAILGLVGVIPDILVGVITIVVGCGILLLGAQTAAAEFAHAGPAAGASGGITLDFLAGGTGIVLGILGLFSHLAELAPAALIVFGCTLLLVGGTMARRRLFSAVPAETLAEEIGAAAGGAQLLIGVAAIVLGILALVPIHALVLTLVGLLTVGAGLLVTSLGQGAGLGYFLRS